MREMTKEKRDSANLKREYTTLSVYSRCTLGAASTEDERDEGERSLNLFGDPEDRRIASDRICRNIGFASLFSLWMAVEADCRLVGPRAFLATGYLSVALARWQPRGTPDTHNLLRATPYTWRSPGLRTGPGGVLIGLARLPNPRILRGIPTTLMTLNVDGTLASRKRKGEKDRRTGETQVGLRKLTRPLKKKIIKFQNSEIFEAFDVVPLSRLPEKP